GQARGLDLGKRLAARLQADEPAESVRGVMGVAVRPSFWHQQFVAAPRVGGGVGWGARIDNRHPQESLRSSAVRLVEEGASSGWLDADDEAQPVRVGVNPQVLVGV